MSNSNKSNFWLSLLKKIIKIILKNVGLSTYKPTHNQHVVPHPDGWAVKGEGNEKYTAIYDTQRDAIERAKDIAFNNRADVIIHRSDGTIPDYSWDFLLQSLIASISSTSGHFGSHHS